METGSWHVTKQGRIKRTAMDFLNKDIVFLDDHSLYRDGVKRLCFDLFLKKMRLIQFDNGDAAYNYLVEELREGRPPALILTDILHPGMQGNDFVKAIRRLEKEMNTRHRIPIVVLSMVPETTFPELTADNIVDSYLPKTAEAEEIVDSLKRVMKL